MQSKKKSLPTSTPDKTPDKKPKTISKLSLSKNSSHPELNKDKIISPHQ
jgi:hypothetical protein